MRREEHIRWAIRWLHELALEMTDPHAQLVLNSAAFNMSWAAKRLGLDARKYNGTHAPAPDLADERGS